MVTINKLVIMVYFTFVVLNVSFIKLGGAVPVRTALPLMFIFVFLLLPPLRKYIYGFYSKPLAIIFIIFFISGFLATTMNESSMMEAILFSVKWIVQPYITMCFTFIVCRVLGYKYCIYITMIAFSITFLFSIAQYINIDFAWTLKNQLDSVQNTGKELINLDDINFETLDGTFDDNARSRGLSWSPIHLSYQALLMVGICLLARYKYQFSFNIKVNSIMLFLCLFSIIASGTRSALLGFLIGFVLFYISRFRNKLMLIFVISILTTCIVFVVPWMSELLNLRVIQANDSSATMRLPLYYFGFLLVVNQPWGYGWVDQSIYHAQDYWHILNKFEGAGSIFLRGLHNYIFNLLWVYGVLGCLGIFFFVKYIKIRYGGYVLLSLIPYFVNSLFHNGGVFYGGNYIWIFIGLFEAVYYVNRNKEVAV